MLADEPTFPIQTNQFQVHTPNHLLYLELTHRANISPALNQPRARYQTTETALSPKAHWNYSTNPKIFSFPCLVFPTENITKAVVCAFSSLLSASHTGASPVALNGKTCLSFLGQLFLQWHWPLRGLLSHFYKLRAGHKWSYFSAFFGHHVQLFFMSSSFVRSSCYCKKYLFTMLWYCWASVDHSLTAQCMSSVYNLLPHRRALIICW